MPAAFHTLCVALVSALVLTACGGKSTGSAERPTTGREPADAPVVADASRPLTEAECMQLLDHYLELALADKRATLPPEQVPTDEQVARIRTSLRDEAKETCIGKTERSRYECAMRAGTTRALGECLAEEPESGG